MNMVRWGLLSTANINRRVIPAIHLSARGDLVAVASRDIARARSYASQWEIPKAFGSYEEMLESGEVDAVYISLPNSLHAEWTIRALEAGVHVLCEKPFAVTLEETDRMIDASRKTGKVLAEAFMYRHHPQTKMVGEWVRRGRLGEITEVRGTFLYKMTNRDGNVRLLPPDQGGGSMWDVGVYPMSMAQYIFGAPPEAVFARQWIGPSGVDESFSGLMWYPGGGTAQISAGFRTPFYTNVDIIGAEGILTLTRPFLHPEEGQITFIPVDGDPQPLTIPRRDLYLGEIEDMQAAILDGAKNDISLEDTRNHMRTALALYESARSGRPVSLE
jgi:predicted dehydrogenase